jgi:PKD repeat protein
VLSDNGNGSGSLQFTPGFSDAGSYVITLVVSDGGLSDTTTFQLSVTQVNLPPVLAAIANQQVAEGETLVVPVSASDPDGDNISISAINIPVFGSLVDNGNGTATITFTPNFGDVGNYSVIIIAVDNGQPSLSDTVSFNLSVGDVNRPPVITPIANMQIPEGSIQNVQITATDPDGDFVILAAQNLPPFGLFADNGGGMGNIRLSPGYQDAGSYLIRVIATDTGSPSLKDTVEFTVVVENNNRAPIIANINDQQVEEGSILNVPVTASDPDSDIVIFSAAGLPSFGLFTDNGNGSGNFRFSPGYNDAGVYHISLIATDTGSPQKSDTISFVMTVSNNNRAPQLQPISDQAMSENDTLIMALTATDPDGDSLIYQVSGLPQFGQFTDNGDGTGELLFFPDYDDAGVYAITIQVSDTSTPPGTATLSFELTVENLNRPPVIAAIPDTTVSEGQELFIALTATDPDNDAIIFIAENLPAFAHLADSGNGQSTLYLQPGFSDTGVYPDVRIISLDTGLLSDTTVFQITVTDSNSAPVATADTLTLLEDESGILYILQNDYDPNGDPFKISAILDTLAYGNIIVLPGDSALQYEPQANFFGNMSFRYEISDSAGLADTTSVLLKIMPVNDPPQITGLPDSITISGDSLVILNLSTFVTDVDDPFTTLTINFVSQPDTFNFQLVPDSGIVKITAKNPASSLVASVSITVTDTAGATATDTLIVQVIGAVGIDEQMANTPKEFEVFQNYPNPFNPTTTIKFGLPGTTHVKVSIFNTLGQRVAILLDETRPAGYHQVVFDAKTISSGMYFYVVETKTNRKIHKMLLIK